MSKPVAAGVSVMRADLDAATSTSADVQEAQWRSGVNRQALPDAASHQQAASRAAADKRKATAMSGQEKAAAERRWVDHRNAAKRAKRAAATAVAEAAATAAAANDSSSSDSEDSSSEQQPDLDELNDMLETAGHDAIDDDEYDAFGEWCMRRGAEMHEESYADWYASDGQRWREQQEADEWQPESESEDAELAVGAPPPPPPPPPPPSAQVTEDPDPLGPLSYLRPRVDDWQPSGGDWDPWGEPPSDDAADDLEGLTGAE